MPAPAPAQEQKLIGVPEGYSVPQGPSQVFQPGGLANANYPGLGSTLYPSGRPNLPAYRQGDELDIASWSVENVARLQARMSKAGLIGPQTQFRVGVADDTTLSAYNTLLALSNRYAVPAMSMLDQLESSPIHTGAGGTASGPTTHTTITTTPATFTDPMDARATVRQAFQARLHRDPTAEEIKAFREQLHDEEKGTASTTTTTSRTSASGDVTRSNTTTDAQDVAEPGVLADQMTRRGKLGREANTQLAAIDYFGAMVAANGAITGG